MVGKIRTLLTGEFPSEKSRVYKTKHGSVALMNTANIGKISQSAPLHSSEKDVENKELERLRQGASVTVTAQHPFFPNQFGTITGLLYPDTANVLLDTGEQELFLLKHLLPSLPII